MFAKFMRHLQNANSTLYVSGCDTPELARKLSRAVRSAALRESHTPGTLNIIIPGRPCDTKITPESTVRESDDPGMRLTKLGSGTPSKALRGRRP